MDAVANTLTLSLATWDHDRVMALHEGRVGVPGVQLKSVIETTQKLFPAAVGPAPHDITEMSISSYILQVSRGVGDYIAIPAFVSRAFRHAGFFARKGESPADFAGRTIGVPEYQMTAALWMRGILKDEYGVDAARVRWRTGALDAGVRRERLELSLPEGMIVEPIDEGETLQSLLQQGEIDGLLAPKPPQAARALRRLPRSEGCRARPASRGLARQRQPPVVPLARRGHGAHDRHDGRRLLALRDRREPRGARRRLPLQRGTVSRRAPRDGG